MKRGFTLVELAIVLVIIGLLVGGLLVAKSMISTSKLQSAVRQIGQYDSAIANFVTKYNQYPGDSNLFAHPGDNNGETDFPWAYGYMWEHLSAGTNLKNRYGNNYVAFSPYGDATEADCPRLPFEGNEGDSPCLIFFYIWYANGGNGVYSYRTHGVIDTQVSGSLTPLMALEFDKKMDDGLATTGNMYYSAWGGVFDNCIAGTAYNISYTGFVCSPQFNVGIVSGATLQK